jgi:hypothetical protein
VFLLASLVERRYLLLEGLPHRVSVPLWRLGFPRAAQILYATGPLPSFEVVTIKLAHGQMRFRPGGPIGPSNIVQMVNITARGLISGAYNLPFLSEGRVRGGPEWVDATTGSRTVAEPNAFAGPISARCGLPGSSTQTEKFIR